MVVESTPLIRMESSFETLEAITRNWKWIGAFGLFNLLFGFACLSFPVLASQAVELALSYTVLVAGCFHLFAACYSEEGSMFYLLAIGSLQIVISFLMFVNPFGVLTVLTFIIAVVFMMAGSFQIAMARQNPGMAARGLNMISGVLAIVMSVIIMLGFPATSWFTIGILIGVNHINIGVCRIVIAFYGLSLSRSQNGLSAAEPVFPGWMV